MDSENGAINSREYFLKLSNSEPTFLNCPNGYISNSDFLNVQNSFTSQSPINSPIGGGFHIPYPQIEYHQEFSPIAQVPLGSSNPYIHSRFQWTSDTKPDFAFSSNSTQPGLLNSFATPSTGTCGNKRKTKSPTPIPCKQHISEERMAEHMSRLHISSQTPRTPKETESVRECRLYICDEMKRLQSETIIPIQILERVQRPCTALIPWRPPVLLPDKENINNNEEQETDCNVPLLSDYGIMDMGS